MDNKIISINDFCKMFECSKLTAVNLFKNNTIVANKINRKWHTTYFSIVNYIETQKKD